MNPGGLGIQRNRNPGPAKSPFSWETSFYFFLYQVLRTHETVPEVQGVEKKWGKEKRGGQIVFVLASFAFSALNEPWDVGRNEKEKEVT